MDLNTIKICYNVLFDGLSILIVEFRSKIRGVKHCPSVCPYSLLRPAAPRQHSLNMASHGPPKFSLCNSPQSPPMDFVVSPNWQQLQHSYKSNTENNQSTKSIIHKNCGVCPWFRHDLSEMLIYEYFIYYDSRKQTLSFLRYTTPFNNPIQQLLGIKPCKVFL